MEEEEEQEISQDSSEICVWQVVWEQDVAAVTSFYKYTMSFISCWSSRSGPSERSFDEAQQINARRVCHSCLSLIKTPGADCLEDGAVPPSESREYLCLKMHRNNVWSRVYASHTWLQLNVIVDVINNNCCDVLGLGLHTIWRFLMMILGRTVVFKVLLSCFCELSARLNSFWRVSRSNTKQVSVRWEYFWSAFSF